MSDFPTVALAGKVWPVKPLVVLQLRVVVPAIMRLTKMVPTSITEEQYADLIDVVYQGVAPAQTPPLKKDEFMAMSITLREMIAALDVIMAQAGLIRKADAPGEAVAGSPPTGTP